MAFTLISQDEFRRCIGVVGKQPEHSNWTLTPYNGGLIKEFHDVATDTWIESASEEEVNLYNQEQIEILNENQYNELQPYDWYFTRFIRKGIEVPKEVIDITNEIDERYKKLKEKFK